MSFIQNLPDDYYQTNIIKEYHPLEINNINYEKPIYQRNPEILNKLTLNHIEVIEFFIRLLKPKNFLELGVQFGECTKKIIELIPNKYIGVDIQKNNNIDYFINKYKNFEFYEMSTDDYFKKLKIEKTKLDLDMVFIDACHSHEATYTDFLNVKDYVNQDGFIFFHDCYPYSTYWTDQGLCGDAYKTSELIRKNYYNEYEILTLPVNPGISIVRKCTKQLHWL